MSMMMPVAKRLESISDKIMMTGETMLCNNKHENHDSSTDENDSGLTNQTKKLFPLIVSGFVSSYRSSLCQSKSYAVIEKPVYEKVLCNIPIILADDDGVKVESVRGLHVEILMNETEDDVRVNVDTKLVHDQDGFKITFSPPRSGSALLSVTFNNIHLRYLI